MKIMWCQECGDMISPNRGKRQPRSCQCGRYTVWWEDPNTGVVRVHDKYRGMFPSNVWLIGLTNAFLGYPHGIMPPSETKRLIDAHDDGYLFKQYESLVVKFQPGRTNDSAWSEWLPGQEPLAVKLSEQQGESE